MTFRLFNNKQSCCAYMPEICSVHRWRFILALLRTDAQMLTRKHCQFLSKILTSYTIYTASDFQSACIHTIDLLESCQEGWFRSVTQILYQIRDHTKERGSMTNINGHEAVVCSDPAGDRSDRGHEPDDVWLSQYWFTAGTTGRRISQGPIKRCNWWGATGWFTLKCQKPHVSLKETERVC